MRDHIEVNRHLKALPEHAALCATFLGQAHIAGTGPAGKTCRECALWGVKHYNKQGGGLHPKPRPFRGQQQGAARRPQARPVQLRDPRQGRAAHPTSRPRLPLLPAE